MKKLLLISIIALASVWVSGCAGVIPDEANATTGLAVNIIFPAEGAQLSEGEIIMIKTRVEHAEGAVQAILFVNDAVVRIDDLKVPLFKGAMLQGWAPAKEGAYTLKTVFIGAEGTQLTSAILNVFVGEGAADALAGTATPTPETDFGATATPTPMPSSTPTLSPPMATGKTDSNCRFGPGNVYDVISFLLTDQTSLIVGKSDPIGWWLIQRMDGVKGSCWVADSLVILSGDIDAVPIVAAPPTSTPTPVDTLTPTPTVTPTPTTASLNPPMPISPSGSMTCTSSVDLVWGAVTHPNGVDRYRWVIQRANPKTGVFSSYDAGNTTNTQVNVVVDCGTDFKWRVRVVDGLGNVSDFSSFTTFTVKTP